MASSQYGIVKGLRRSARDPAQTRPPALVIIAAAGHRRVDQRSAVHPRRRGIRRTAPALAHLRAGTMIKATPPQVASAQRSETRAIFVLGHLLK